MADDTIQSVADRLAQKAIDLAAQMVHSSDDGMRRYTASMRDDAMKLREMAAMPEPSTEGSAERYNAEVARLKADETKTAADKAAAEHVEQQQQADDAGKKVV